MIKIGPLMATDYGQTCALLGLQEEQVLDVTSLTESGLVLQSLSFWQHWVPCQFHVTPSIYVAKEENTVIGFIALHNVGKAKTCWRVDHLVVHPQHRGRGIAQELLKYVFAQFGSQGVTHFIAELSAHNSAALSLFAAGGFCRSTQVTYYRLEPNAPSNIVEPQADFRVASPIHKLPLYMVTQDSLPPDLRLVLNLTPEDFRVRDLLPFTSVEKRKNRLMRTRVWYWISEDAERKAITASVKVTAQPQLGYRLDFAVHPGWRHLTADLVNYTVNNLIQGVPQMPVWARVYDFQAEVHDTLKARGFDRAGSYFLLAREHWQRAKHPKARKVDPAAALKQITNPAINYPLGSE